MSTEYQTKPQKVEAFLMTQAARVAGRTTWPEWLQEAGATGDYLGHYYVRDEVEEVGYRVVHRLAFERQFEPVPSEEKEESGATTEWVRGPYEEIETAWLAEDHCYAARWVGWPGPTVHDDYRPGAIKKLITLTPTLMVTLANVPTADVRDAAEVARGIAVDVERRVAALESRMEEAEASISILRGDVKVFPSMDAVIEALNEPEPQPVRSSQSSGSGSERDGASLIAAERRRQVEKEGWTAEHDDTHTHGEMAVTAALLAVDGTDAWVGSEGDINELVSCWGLEKHKGNRVRQLVIAGALIAAEIDREVRAGSSEEAQGSADRAEALRGDGPTEGASLGGADVSGGVDIASGPVAPALNALEPCPFCGAAPAVTYNYPPQAHGYADVRIRCSACGLSVHRYGEEDEARRAAGVVWNRRSLPAPTAQQEPEVSEGAELEELLRDFEVAVRRLKLAEVTDHRADADFSKLDDEVGAARSRIRARFEEVEKERDDAREKAAAWIAIHADRVDGLREAEADIARLEAEVSRLKGELADHKERSRLAFEDEVRAGKLVSAELAHANKVILNHMDREVALEEQIRALSRSRSMSREEAEKLVADYDAARDAYSDGHVIEPGEFNEKVQPKYAALINAILSAPSVEQEPVAARWMVQHIDGGGRWMDGGEDDFFDNPKEAFERAASCQQASRATVQVARVVGLSLVDATAPVSEPTPSPVVDGERERLAGFLEGLALDSERNAESRRADVRAAARLLRTPVVREEQDEGMVERVAKWLWEDKGPREAWEAYDEPSHDVYRAAARRLIRECGLSATAEQGERFRYLDTVRKGCGLYHAPLALAREVYPDVPWHVLDAVLDPAESYIVDVKRHMLMPGMYPCIPNWHRDFVPRDAQLVEHPELIDPTKKMWMWLDGPPFTEFRDGREITKGEWVEFTQEDEHRGVPATAHGWRTFVRVAPESIMRAAGVGDVPAAPADQIRLHTQVYLNADDYAW